MKIAEILRSQDSRLQPTISTPRLIGEGSLVIKPGFRIRKNKATKWRLSKGIGCKSYLIKIPQNQSNAESGLNYLKSMV